MISRKIFLLPIAMVTAFLMIFSVPQPSSAQSLLAGGIIEEIRIEGTQRVDPLTVRSYMELDPGDTFDAVALDNALKNLFDTGLFADVNFARDGNTLIVNLEENPIINRIAFEGNRRVSDETLQDEIELRPRTVFTRTKVQQDVQRILSVYRRSGRFAASVEPQLITLEQNRVDLVFEITEGERTDVYSINFIGNEAFSDSSLRDEIVTEETSWLNFLSATDTYDPDRLEFDKELLRRHYLEEGYADFKVLSGVAELAPDRSGFILTFTVEEGERYTFGPIDVQTTLKGLDTETLEDEIDTVEGEWYDATEVEDTINNLTEIVSNMGYAFVEVTPDVTRNPDDLTIEITYNINEGPKVFVERIDIQGNFRTLDKVIRREFRFSEGDAFNAAKLRRSRQRISNLGFFRSIDISSVEGSTPDRTILIVDVEEQSTGDLSFGAGFSTADGPLANVQIRERNLLGRGQDLRLNFTISGESSEVDLSFTEPYFLDKELSAGFDLFRTFREFDEAFDQERIGASLRLGYDLTEHTRQLFRYTFSVSELSDIEEFSSIREEEEEGKTYRSIVSHTLSWDHLDNRFDPQDGYIVEMTNSFAGLGGDVAYLLTEVSAGYYFPLAERTTLAFKGDVGAMDGLWKDTFSSDRFRLGDETFRGFEFGGIGPHDVITGDRLGGKYYYKGTTEFSFPVGLPDEFDVRGRLFADFGAVFGTDFDGDVDDSSSPRLTVGPGIYWNSPFGPIRLDFGFPIIKEDFDETQRLTFSFGAQF